MSTYDFQSLVVLPSIRLNRLRQAVLDIVGDSGYTNRIMSAIEENLEVDAYRWGNACPETGEQLSWVDLEGVGYWRCPTHTHHSSLSPTELLIAFKPSEPS